MSLKTTAIKRKVNDFLKFTGLVILWQIFIKMENRLWKWTEQSRYNQTRVYWRQTHERTFLPPNAEDRRSFTVYSITPQLLHRHWGVVSFMLLLKHILNNYM